MNSTSEVELAVAGRSRIDWAGRSMPALHQALKRLTEQGTVAGMRIGISLVIDPKTAVLITGLRKAQANVAVFASSHYADVQVLAALEQEGVVVFSNPKAREQENLDVARAFLATSLQILVDDGSRLTRLMHREFPRLVETMLGATEDATSGVRALRAMHADGELKVPVIAVSDSPLKHLFDDAYGAGQSCVMALLDLTNLQIAGRKLLVIGYGWVGKGVAQHAAALGALVSVAEVDPIKALQAQHDGHRVCAIQTAASDCEVVFAATGVAGALTAEHLLSMPDGVILCSAGAGDVELPMAYLRSQSEPETLRDHIDKYELHGGRSVIVVAEGHRINLAGGEGSPIESADLALALQVSAIESLATRSLERGVHGIDSDLESEIAQHRLMSADSSTEPLTGALDAEHRDW